MAMTLQELISRVVLEAAHYMPDHKQILDGEVIAELILPRCIDILVSDLAKNREETESLKSNTTLSMTSGVSTDFPETIRPEFVESIYITTDRTASYVPHYYDYTRSATNLLMTGIFCYHNAQLHYAATGALLTAYSGSLIINSIVIPTLPAIASSFSARDRFVEKLITFAAKVISGQTALPELDYASKE